MCIIHGAGTAKHNLSRRMQASSLPKHVILGLAILIQTHVLTHFLTVMTQPENVKPTWREIGPNTACDMNAGEVYLEHASAPVSSLEECKRLCENNVACRSITLFSNGWCGLFSTSCTSTKYSKKGFTMYLIAGSDKTGTCSSSSSPIHAWAAHFDFWSWR